MITIVKPQIERSISFIIYIKTNQFIIRMVELWCERMKNFGKDNYNQ